LGQSLVHALSLPSHGAGLSLLAASYHNGNPRRDLAVGPPSPSSHAIDEACATLSVHLNILGQVIRGKSPITATVEDEFALAARQLDMAVPALNGTQGGLT
jgi:hypothetical protein